MSTDLFEKANRLNQTLFAQFSKATEMQMEAFRRYADLAMGQKTCARTQTCSMWA